MSAENAPASINQQIPVAATRRGLLLGLPVIAAAAGACTPTPRSALRGDERTSGDETAGAWSESEHVKRFYALARF